MPVRFTLSICCAFCRNRRWEREVFPKREEGLRPVLWRNAGLLGHLDMGRADSPVAVVCSRNVSTHTLPAPGFKSQSIAARHPPQPTALLQGHMGQIPEG